MGAKRSKRTEGEKRGDSQQESGLGKTRPMDQGGRGKDKSNWGREKEDPRKAGSGRERTTSFPKEARKTRNCENPKPAKKKNGAPRTEETAVRRLCQKGRTHVFGGQGFHRV